MSLSESPSMVHYTRLVWYLLPVAIGIVIFGNHYARDAMGSLEKQLEMDLLSAKQFYSLNSLFFSPNIITPFLAGGLLKQMGGPAVCLLLSVALGGLGHIIFAYGIEYHNYGIMVLGRLLAGSMYEVIDTIPIVIMGPFYATEMGFVCGAMNSFLRLGSVLNFIVSPYLYRRYSLAAAFLFAGGMAFSGSIFAVITLYWDRHLSAVFPVDSKGDVQSMSPSSSNDDEKMSLAIQQQLEKSESQAGNRMDNISTKDYCIHWMKNTFPLHLLSYQFYFYTLAGGFLYGAMVPFWFIGSKYLQDYYKMSVGAADTLMLFPEGIIVIVAIPLGIVLDRFGWMIRSKLILLSVSTALLPVAYVLLVYGGSHGAGEQGRRISISPVYIFLLLGIGYAFSNSIFWSITTFVVGRNHLLGSASGLLGSTMNILPSIIPSITAITVGAENATGCLLILSVVGVLGSLAALLSAFLPGVEGNVEQGGSDRLSAISKAAYEMVERNDDNENDVTV